MAAIDSISIPDDCEPLRERFEAKIAFEPMSGCWIWLGYVNADGYGVFSWPFPRRALPAHRAAMMIYRHLDPAHSVVGHRCGIRACVNPDHLILGHPHRTPPATPGHRGFGLASAAAHP